MHKIQFPVTFISAAAHTKTTDEGEKRYYVANLMAGDGNIDRFFLDKTTFDSLAACVLGDRLQVDARLFYAPKNTAWAVKIDSITPTI